MDSAASDRPKSWDEEACPWHKGYPDEHGCTCSPEVIARREARSAATTCDVAANTPHEEGEPETIREPVEVSPEVAEAFPVPDWKPVAVMAEVDAAKCRNVEPERGGDPYVSPSHTQGSTTFCFATYSGGCNHPLCNGKKEGCIGGR